MAITVYFLLSVAFYAFFSPFLGKDIYEHVAIGVYSFLVNDLLTLQSAISMFFMITIVITTIFQALCVFILYVRCTAIDPADPGILIDPNRAIASPYRSHNGTEVPG